MSAKITTGRKAGSAARGPRGLERLLIVAAVAAVLVAAGAWIAMNRPFGGAEAAAAQSSLTATGGGSADSPATDAATDAATGTSTAPGDPAAADAAESAAAASAAPAGQGSTGSGTSSSSGSGSGSSRPGAPAAPSSTATAPLSPTTAFLTALTASGLAPPVDDAQKLAMADDVCQELGNGSTYDDVVRALTFAGASDAEAANFAKLAINNICPQYKSG